MTPEERVAEICETYRDVLLGEGSFSERVKFRQAAAAAIREAVAAEREACARAAEHMPDGTTASLGAPSSNYEAGRAGAAAAIRGRE